ncbi:MAG: DUF4199 domain-containing protein [Gemmatimonas sp.]
MFQTVIKFGLISGLIMMACLAATFPLGQRMGKEVSMALGYATMIVSFSVVYFGVRSYRDNVLGGVIGFGRALKAGLLISLITASFYVAAWEVMYFGGFVGDFAKDYAAATVDRQRAAGASQAKIDSTQAEMDKFIENYNNPLINIAYTYLEPMPVILLVTLGTAFALSRRRRQEALA